MTDDHSFRPRPTSLSAALLLGAWIAQLIVYWLASLLRFGEDRRTRERHWS